MFSNEMQSHFKLYSLFRCVPMDLCHISIHFSVVHGLEDVVVSWAVVMACACLNEHHLLLHDLTIRTLELYWEGGCSVRSAATAICANPTKLGSVGLHTCAARKLKLDWFGNFWSADAFLSFLNVFLQISLTRSDHAETALFLKSAVLIVIGNASRDSHTTGL